MFLIISKQLLLSVDFQILLTILNNMAKMSEYIDKVFDFMRWMKYQRKTPPNFIQSVTGGTDQTSGECSLGQTIPI